MESPDPSPNAAGLNGICLPPAADPTSISSDLIKQSDEDEDEDNLLLLNFGNKKKGATVMPHLDAGGSPTLISTTPPMLRTGFHSDAEDSVCADIDRWAGSSMEGDEHSRGSSQLGESARLQEMEAEQQRLSESMLALSSQFAQIQFRIQQIAQAPGEQRDEMLQQLQQFASKSCLDYGALKSSVQQPSSRMDVDNNREQGNGQPTARTDQVRSLIGELRSQLTDLEQFAWKNGHLGPNELPLSELRARQRLVLERLREKMRLQVQLAGPEADADEEQFRRKLEEGLEQAMGPIREKDQLVHQLRTQITDLERYVHLLQREMLEASASAPQSPSKQPMPPAAEQQQQQLLQLQAAEAAAANSMPLHSLPTTANGQVNGGGGGWLPRWFGCSSARRSGHHFERNELKHCPLGNHYGDQRAEMELAVDALVQVMKKNQILSVDREDRGELSVDELSQVILEGGQEAILTSVRKRLCPALRALLEHGLQRTVAPTPRRSGGGGVLPAIGCGIGFGGAGGGKQLNGSRFLRPADLAKFDGLPLTHIWDVLALFLEASRALEMRDAVVGQLTDAFKLDSVSGKTATSKQILLSTIEHINSSHIRLRRSPDSMWKEFVCAALNRNRLPAWIRIIFRSELVLSKCYHSWSYVARTGVEDIRPLLEGLHQFNFDLPVDLAVRQFDQIKEAFG